MDEDEEYESEYEEDEDEDNQGLDEFFAILEDEDLDLDELEIDPEDLVNATTSDLNFLLDSLTEIKRAEEEEADLISIEFDDDDDEYIED